MKYKIESGIPLPSKLNSWDYLVNKMKPGDSVVLESKYRMMALWIAMRRHGFKCETKKIEGDKYRLWKAK